MNMEDAGGRAVGKRAGEDLLFLRKPGPNKKGDDGHEDRRRRQEPSQWNLESGALLEGRRLVRALPRELGLGAAEVAERRRLRVDRLAEVEFLHDAARRELEVRAHELGDLRL